MIGHIEHARKCPAASHRQCEFSLALTRPTYNDADVIEGMLTCTTDRELRLKNVNVSTVCSFRVLDPAQKSHNHLQLGGSVSALLGTDFTFEAGTHSYPFSLQLPAANRPVTFSGNDRKVSWKVVVTAEAPCCGSGSALAAAAFNHTSVYEENLEVAPTAATEAEVFGQSGKIRVDVRLDRVVHSADSPIGVHVFVNNQSQTTCRRVKVSCYQVHEYELFHSMHHYSRTLIDQAYRDVKVVSGQLHESKFALMPKSGEPLPPTCLLTDGELTPSSAAVLDHGNFKMFVRYVVEVQVYYGLMGSQHSTVRVPLTLQHRMPDPEASTQPSRFHEYFCKPPAYDQLPKRSQPLAIGSPELTRHASAHQCPSSCMDCATHALTYTLPLAASSGSGSSPTRNSFFSRRLSVSLGPSPPHDHVSPKQGTNANDGLPDCDTSSIPECCTHTARRPSFKSLLSPLGRLSLSDPVCSQPVGVVV